ncbi:hypothetical protein F5X97DRAFT_318366 [Nemania serpens]|nr:hypothetical protein F5X97DRAFT_318366 [Nemania serpens]
MPSKLINTVDEHVVKHISELLSKAGVASFLWGDYVLRIFGVPSIIGVIPDDELPTAVAALKNSGLKPCPAPKLCIVSREERQSPVPVFHMHIHEQDVSVSLRAHSETLWFAPTPGGADPAWRSYYISASDTSLPKPRPGRGHGALSPDGLEVLIPRAHVLLEAYIRLASAFRDNFANFFLSMVNYMEEYVEPDDLIDDNLLSKPCRDFWDETKKGRRPVIELVNQLQLALNDVPDSR